ncbi:MAG: SDR family oxidoreductase [Ilumatobacteraceae bacterium]
MSAGLAGRVALVTGAASGIGRAIAGALAGAGAAVAIVDRDAEGLAAVTADVPGTYPFTADLADTAGLPGLVDRVSAALGPIDVLVNDAGVLPSTGLLDTDVEVWNRVFAVNLVAPWQLIVHVGRQMIERGGGHVVNIASSSAFRAQSTYGAYGVSKAALVALTRAAAAELGPHGINVNAVAPGPTLTPMIGDPAALSAMASDGPLANLLRRVSVPDDVAGVVLFLCSPASRQMTGQVLHTSAGAVV